MSIESSISSTPPRGLLANTGGIDTVSAVRTTENSEAARALPFLSFFALSFFDFLEACAGVSRASGCLRLFVLCCVCVWDIFWCRREGVRQSFSGSTWQLLP